MISFDMEVFFIVDDLSFPFLVRMGASIFPDEK